MELHEAFINFFEENSMGLITEDWISGVQIALNTSLADNSAAKGTDQNALNILCQKADKLSKDLSDIHKLEVQFRNYYTKCFVEYEDEGEDENEKQRKKLKRDQKKKLLSDEAARLIKVMGDIAVDLGIPRHVEIIHGVIYDVEKGEHKKRADGSSYFVDTQKNLSEAQLKISLFAQTLAHPSPEI